MFYASAIQCVVNLAKLLADLQSIANRVDVCLSTVNLDVTHLSFLNIEFRIQDVDYGINKMSELGLRYEGRFL